MYSSTVSVLCDSVRRGSSSTPSSSACSTACVAVSVACAESLSVSLEVCVARNELKDKCSASCSCVFHPCMRLVSRNACDHDSRTQHCTSCMSDSENESCRNTAHSCSCNGMRGLLPQRAEKASTFGSVGVRPPVVSVLFVWRCT